MIDHVKAYDARFWSTIHVYEGHLLNCTGATVTNNEIGPSGSSDGSWSDGISLACRNSFVAYNTITDATDGAIVVFDATGSLIAHNVIRQDSTTLLGAINMVDYNPMAGDFSGTVVYGNTIASRGAQIKVAIAMGPRVWGCSGPELNKNATVMHNVLTGRYMGYGLAADQVTNWTALANVSYATHSGSPGGGCGPTPASPAAFLRTAADSTGEFQSEFQEGYVESVLGLGAASPPTPPCSGDADCDGMPDAYESAHSCLSSSTEDATGDPDADKMSNIFEYSAGSDPCASEDIDTDGDGCTDVDEDQATAGSETSGGLRNYKNHWDFLDVNGDKVIALFDDILVIAMAFGFEPGDPGYSTTLDRSEPTPAGNYPWRTGPPDGTIDLFTDIFGAAYQFGHDCS